MAVPGSATEEVTQETGGLCCVLPLYTARTSPAGGRI